MLWETQVCIVLDLYAYVQEYVPYVYIFTISIVSRYFGFLYESSQ